MLVRRDNVERTLTPLNESKGDAPSDGSISIAEMFIDMIRDGRIIVVA